MWLFFLLTISRIYFIQYVSAWRQNKYWFFFFNFYFWLCWVFASVWGLSPVVASGGHSSSWCAGLSLSWPLLLQSTGSKRAGSVVVAHGSSCSAACGILPEQGSNPCPLHWQADSQPLHHQGSPQYWVLKLFIPDFLGGAVVKNLPANAGDTSSSPCPGRSHMPQSN